MHNLLSMCHLSHYGRCYELSICHHIDIKNDKFLYIYSWHIERVSSMLPNSSRINSEFESLIKYFVYFLLPSHNVRAFVAPCVCVFVYLAGHPVWTELSKAEGRLDSPQQSHNIQVLYPPPGNSTDVTLK